MFESYRLKRQAVLSGLSLRLSLYVNIPCREAVLTLVVDGELWPVPAPEFREVSTPDLAESWFNRINMDHLAESVAHDKRRKAQA